MDEESTNIRLILAEIINHLKEKRTLLSTKQLAEEIGIDLDAKENAVLKSDLAKNRKVLNEGDSWSYRSNFPHIRCKEELVQALEKSWPRGINVTKLSDAYATVLKDVEELVTDKLAFLATNTEDKHHILFRRSPGLSSSLGCRRLESEKKDQYPPVQLWHSVTMPTDGDIDDYLLKVFGILPREKQIVKLKESSAKRKKRKVNSLLITPVDPND